MLPSQPNHQPTKPPAMGAFARLRKKNFTQRSRATPRIRPIVPIVQCIVQRLAVKVTIAFAAKSLFSLHKQTIIYLLCLLLPFKIGYTRLRHSFAPNVLCATKPTQYKVHPSEIGNNRHNSCKSLLSLRIHCYFWRYHEVTMPTACTQYTRLCCKAVKCLTT